MLSPRRRVDLATVLMAVEDENLTESPADMPAALAERGLRMPSSDEWEHACGAGAGTLFRWGNECPLDRIPYGDRTGPQNQLNRAARYEAAHRPARSGPGQSALSAQHIRAYGIGMSGPSTGSPVGVDDLWWGIPVASRPGDHGVGGGLCGLRPLRLPRGVRWGHHRT